MTKPWVRSIARTALFATVLLAASAASGQVQLEGSAVVRNDKAGAYVIAPKGWILDQQSGASEGFLCVMYPKGSSWRSAGEVMSISIGQILPGKTLADFIETWAAERRKTSPRLEVFDLEPIRLATGQKALVRRFALDQLGTVECVAYAPLDSSVAVYALSSRTAEGYAAGIGLFQEMVAASGIMAMPAAGGSSPGDARSGRPARTPGGYSQWARYKPGAFVTFKYTMTSAQTSGEMLKTIRLKEVTPGFVRLTYQESPAGGARSDYYDHQERDFGEAEQEFTKESPVEALLNYHISDIVGDVRGRTVDSGIEEVELKGIKIATARTKYEVESEGLRTTVSVWWAEDVPGRLWRLVREYAGAVSSREEVVVTDFSAPAASSVELEKLRAGREPVAIEVPALDYLRARCRLPDRLMDMGADFLFRSGDSPSGAATPSP
ncbi:MAG TPA: hypothetical protein VLN41_02205, partial [Candidatus Bathyarchaeia archaeon]|nr:hypothetical protein [Candidatus Bathyarchaeia archaeon]